jgi:hypothetical protein
MYFHQFPEHRIVTEQWSLPWLLRPQNFMPAYFIVGVLAFAEIGRMERFHLFLTASRNRLFFIWFLVVFLLVNHHIVMRPVQPIHFERGYIWIALFLIGGHQLIRLFAALSRKRFGVLWIALFVVIFLSDNALWLGAFPIRTFKGIRLTQDQADLFQWMNANEHTRSIILSQHSLIGYLAPVYTPLRAWWCHPYITPDAKQRLAELQSLFAEGKFLTQWENIPVLVVFSTPVPDERRPEWLANRGAKKVWQNSSYTVFRIDPRKTF